MSNQELNNLSDLGEIWLDGEHVKYWESMTDAYNDLKIYHTSISECCRNNRKTAGGYVWKYAIK